MFNKPKPEPVHIVHDGVTYEGTYHVNKGVVYLESQYGNAQTQQGSGPAQSIALRLLYDVVAHAAKPAV